jgi:ubiquinone/menaquinone biosynthesis C-methylase UbiE
VPEVADQFDPAHAKKLEDPERLEVLPQAAVVDLLALEGAETVVDYGAGTGIYTVAVAAAVPDGHVVAVEALPRLAQLLREKITPELAARLSLVETQDNVVPLDDGEADRVVMVDVLHHLHDQPEALEEVVRVLRPGGLFVVIDWADVDRPVGPSPGHVLGLDAVRGIVAGMGLEVLEAKGSGEPLRYHVAVVGRKS